MGDRRVMLLSSRRKALAVRNRLRKEGDNVTDFTNLHPAACGPDLHTGVRPEPYAAYLYQPNAFTAAGSNLLFWRWFGEILPRNERDRINSAKNSEEFEWLCLRALEFYPPDLSWQGPSGGN